MECSVHICRCPCIIQSLFSQKAKPLYPRPKYRVSHQYGNTFNFNFLSFFQCYCKSKTSSEKLRFKPSSGNLDFDFFSKIRLVFRLAKNETKRKFFYTRNLLFVRIFAFNQNICGFGQFLYEFLSFGNALRLP